MPRNKPLKESIEEYARGIIGGLLFSFPLLYTMEVWEAAYAVQPFNLMILIVATFLLLLGYNRYAGMHPSTTWKNVVIDSVEELGIGLLMSFLILLMLNRIQIGDSSLDEIMGKVIMEAMFVSIGVSIGTAQLGSKEKDKEDNSDSSEEETNGLKNPTSRSAMVVLALCGSIVVGGSVAPTEEVFIIALEAKPFHILWMATASLLMSTVVIYFSNFKGTEKRDKKPTIYEIVFDTCLIYLTALMASAFILWYFGDFANQSTWNIISQTIVLGVIASLGASAGRLLIK